MQIPQQRKGESQSAFLERLRKHKQLLELQKFRWFCRRPDCDGLPHPHDPVDEHPFKHARANQHPSQKFITAWITGRGFGKTRSGAEAVKDRVMRHKKHRVAIICPTFAVARDVAIEGESGLLACLPPDIRNQVRWNRSTGELFFPNESKIKLFGADKATDAEAIRGYQTHTVWFEELATIRHAQSAWDMAMYANRLRHPDPKVFVTTTPKPTPLIRWLLQAKQCAIITGSIFDNRANLAESTLELLADQYEGTRLGRQELYGELLEDVEGSLWSSELIEAHRWKEVPELRRVVVAVDPAGSSGKSSDETGIVVVGLTPDRECVVLADYSGRYSPQQWAAKAIDAYLEHNADRIVAEVNFGGDLVESNIRSMSPAIPFKKVHASRGKTQRAEPVVSLYEQGRVHHIGSFPDLEDQLCSWVPGESSISPDRMDALVWGVTELGLTRHRPRPMITHFSAV